MLTQGRTQATTFGRAARLVMTAPMYPLRFEPILKRLIWGGRRLATVLGKPLGEGTDYAESWEISDHRDDVSRVADGPLAGRRPARPRLEPQGRRCSARPWRGSTSSRCW